MDKFIAAVKEFREAFIIAVDDKSPFAKIALNRLDTAIRQVQAQQKDKGVAEHHKQLAEAGFLFCVCCKKQIAPLI